MRRLILAAVLLLAMNACDDDSRGSGADDDNDNSGPTEPDEPTAPGSFTAFVIDMVTEHTVDDAAPMEYRTFEMLPDPDGDSNNVDAYRSLF